MNRFHELLKEGKEMRFLRESGLPLRLNLRIGEEDAGMLSFDGSMMDAEFSGHDRSFSIRKERKTLKTIVRDGVRESASCSEQKLGTLVILTEDSNILFLKNEGFWDGCTSLIEYETGCWFLKFFPEKIAGQTSIRVEVSPVFIDADDLLELSALSVFELVRDERELRK